MGSVRRLSVTGWILGVTGLVLVAGGLGWSWGGQERFTVGGDAMEPTYAAGDRVVVEEVPGGEIGRGDVVIYSAPEVQGFDDPVIKRVVGLGGDRVVCCVGAGTGQRLLVDGRPLAEPYVADGIVDGRVPGGGNEPYEVTVPEGRLFVLGDQRANSNDSRSYGGGGAEGTVPVEAVLGRVVDERAVPVGSIVLAGAGVVAAVLGLLLGLRARGMRRRAGVPAPVWPTGPQGV
ncbi:signal peptidase I [Streptomyces sp. enrichment culture]|uniref:signal peptidase I n=1 Tax=Streptomyces sp. enrichment culture TaxID=1795815 RepID=UPI003F572DA9